MSKPKELYRFVEQAAIPIVWTVTSADTDELHAAEIYTAVAIGRDNVEQKNELSKANLTVSVSLDNAMARRWLRTSVDAQVGLTLFRKDVESGNVVVAWKGRLASVKPSSKAIELMFESVFTSLRRPGLRMRYQRSCPHALYGAGCNAPKENFAVLGAATNVAGVLVVVPEAAAYPSGWFTTGILQAPDGTMRFITAHSGANITLIRPMDSLKLPANAATVNVTLFPGCDRSLQMCKDKFNNLNNNGAFPFIPLKNPFGGTSIV